ncbi:MerR family transcriptional regulator [Rhodococcus sp. P1Y]|uniref:MerR family transcriptional regulator n=1 Tax=Rhodococcus sp. P1Y TaxID=1302308 RepID=UPI000EAF85D2|nr:MerR family transcriptional regulator [Rhodococcus sp. P1Y]AYJ47235.1 MerR family transcriptional regulator [Rhodococcus sp. P1Y]
MATVDLMGRALAASAGSDTAIDALHGLIDTGEIVTPIGIAEAAELLDVTAHTLRYYERAGLIVVDRDGQGYRQYDANAVRRLVFISRMRLSGMPMRDLQHYVELVDRGDSTVPERLEFLVKHRETIRRRIQELQLSLAATEYKIETYGGATGP